MYKQQSTICQWSTGTTSISLYCLQLFGLFEATSAVKAGHNTVTTQSDCMLQLQLLAAAVGCHQQALSSLTARPAVKPKKTKLVHSALFQLRGYQGARSQCCRTASAHCSISRPTATQQLTHRHLYLRYVSCSSLWHSKCSVICRHVCTFSQHCTSICCSCDAVHVAMMQCILLRPAHKHEHSASR